MEKLLKESRLLIFMSLTLFSSTIEVVILLNLFHGAKAYFNHSFGEISHQELLEEAKNCSIPEICVEKLYIECRNFNEIPQDIQNSSDIQVFSMGNLNNKLNILKEGQLAKANLPKLVELDLTYCEIHTIEKGAFSTEITILRELYLSGNKIETLNPEVFGGLSELTSLHLDGNPIKEFETNKMFPPGLVELRVLNLGHCQLHSLPDNLFDNLELHTLFLHANQFKYMSWRSFSNTTIVESLTLFDNLWHCDCNVRFLIGNLLQNNLFNEIENVICATSPNEDFLAGLSWLEIERDKFACLPQVDTVQLASPSDRYNKADLQDSLDLEGELALPVGQDVYIKCIFSGYPQPQVQLKMQKQKMGLTINDQAGTEAQSISKNQIGHISNAIEERHIYFKLKQPSSNPFEGKLSRSPEADNHTVINDEEWRQNYTYEDVFVIKNAQKENSGRYSCQVSNIAGTVAKTFDLNFIDERRPGNWKMYLWVTIAFLVLSLVAILLWLKFSKEMSCLEFGQRKSIEHGEDTFEFDQQLELDIGTDICIDIENVLGSGNFGTVYKGQVKGEDVAIKRLNINTSSATIKSLKSELKVLCFIGIHKNVIGFIGACTKEIPKGILYIVTELCNNGSLLNFLQTKKLFLADNPDDYTSIQPNEFVSFKNLCSFSSEIASGMEYIAGMKVVHGDLSARNVLLDTENVCKIGDFGLARKLYEYQEYVKTSDEPLPWKWMAYESLTKMEFTSKSDVWSYGVTLWEIFNSGNVPFSGLDWTADFVEDILNGLRLPAPPNTPCEIYSKLLECWKLDAEERPQFQELATFFRNIEEIQDSTFI